LKLKVDQAYSTLTTNNSRVIVTGQFNGLAIEKVTVMGSNATARGRLFDADEK
jgi:hypothetical protein